MSKVGVSPAAFTRRRAQASRRNQPRRRRALTHGCARSQRASHRRAHAPTGEQLTRREQPASDARACATHYASPPRTASNSPTESPPVRSPHPNRPHPPAAVRQCAHRCRTKRPPMQHKPLPRRQASFTGTSHRVSHSSQSARYTIPAAQALSRRAILQCNKRRANAAAGAYDPTVEEPPTRGEHPRVPERPPRGVRRAQASIAMGPRHPQCRRRERLGSPLLTPTASARTRGVAPSSARNAQ